MRILRPASLALLSAVVGLGVPAGFAQQGKSSKSPSKSSANTSSKKRGSASSTGKSSNAASTAKGASAASHHSNSPSKKASGKSYSGKLSSRRSRRQPGQKAPAADRVTEIQSALAKDGSFSGTPNGKWDDGTTAAIRKFQAAHGLNPTGKLDAPTLQRLGLGSQTAGVAAPTPPPGAVSRLTSSVLVPSSSGDNNPQR